MSITNGSSGDGYTVPKWMLYLMGMAVPWGAWMNVQVMGIKAQGKVLLERTDPVVAVARAEAITQNKIAVTLLEQRVKAVEELLRKEKKHE